MFVTVIIACQLAIETKRCLVRRAETRADLQALSALKQMEEATKKLNVQPPLELRIGVKEAWTADSQPGSRINSFQLPNRALIIEKTRPDINKSSKEQAVRIARFVSLYGIFPALVTIFNMSVSSEYGVRPHASTGSFLSIYGVFIPFSFIVSNPKIKAFAKEYLQLKRLCNCN
jgi:hypothetical protein